MYHTHRAQEKYLRTVCASSVLHREAAGRLYPLATFHRMPRDRIPEDIPSLQVSHQTEQYVTTETDALAEAKAILF